MLCKENSSPNRSGYGSKLSGEGGIIEGWIWLLRFQEFIYVFDGINASVRPVKSLVSSYLGCCIILSASRDMHRRPNLKIEGRSRDDQESMERCSSQFQWQIGRPIRHPELLNSPKCSGIRFIASRYINRLYLLNETK